MVDSVRRTHGIDELTVETGSFGCPAGG